MYIFCNISHIYFHSVPSMMCVFGCVYELLKFFPLFALCGIAFYVCVWECVYGCVTFAFDNFIVAHIERL